MAFQQRGQNIYQHQRSIIHKQEIIHKTTELNQQNYQRSIQHQQQQGMDHPQVEFEPIQQVTIEQPGLAPDLNQQNYQRSIQHQQGMDHPQVEFEPIQQVKIEQPGLAPDLNQQNYQRSIQHQHGVDQPQVEFESIQQVMVEQPGLAKQPDERLQHQQSRPMNQFGQKSTFHYENMGLQEGMKSPPVVPPKPQVRRTQTHHYQTITQTPQELLRRQQSPQPSERVNTWHSNRTQQQPMPPHSLQDSTSWQQQHGMTGSPSFKQGNQSPFQPANQQPSARYIQSPPPANLHHPQSPASHLHSPAGPRGHYPQSPANQPLSPGQFSPAGQPTPGYRTQSPGTQPSQRQFPQSPANQPPPGHHPQSPANQPPVYQPQPRVPSGDQKTNQPGQAYVKLRRAEVEDTMKPDQMENGKDPVTYVDGKCTCCPYGYHIDLDFINFCDSMANGNLLLKLKKIKRHKRQLRKSMEIYLQNQDSNETATYTPQESLFSMAEQDESATKEILAEIDSSVDAALSSIDTMFAPGPKKSKPVSDADFSQPRQSHSRSESISSLSSVEYDRSPVFPSQTFGHFSSTHETQNDSTHHITSQQIAANMASCFRSDSPTNSDASTQSQVTPQQLQNIREQMAVSLKRLRELEDQVKAIPLLQVRISVLKEEKRIMMLQLEAKNKRPPTRTLGVGDGSVDDYERPRGRSRSQSPTGRAFEMSEFQSYRRTNRTNMSRYLLQSDSESSRSSPTLKPDTKSTGVGDSDVRQPYFLQPRLVEKAELTSALRNIVSHTAVHSEHHTRIHEKEIHTVIVNQALKQQEQQQQQQQQTSVQFTQQTPLTEHKKPTRTIGVGEGNVFDDGTSSSSRMHLHEKELRTVILADTKKAVVTRNVGVSVRVPTRDVGVTFVHEVEKPRTRDVGINVEEVTYRRGLRGESGEFAQYAAMARGGAAAGGEYGYQQDDSHSSSSSASSKFVTTRFTEKRSTNIAIHEQKVKMALRDALKFNVKSVGCMVRMSNVDKETMCDSIKHVSVGCSEDSIDVEVKPRVMTRSVGVEVKPSTCNGITWTERLYAFDAATNTTVPQLIQRATNTSKTVAYPAATNTEAIPLYSVGSNTDVNVFLSTKQLRHEGVNAVTSTSEKSNNTERKPLVTQNYDCQIYFREEGSDTGRDLVVTDGSTNTECEKCIARQLQDEAEERWNSENMETSSSSYGGVVGGGVGVGGGSRQMTHHSSRTIIKGGAGGAGFDRSGASGQSISKGELIRNTRGFISSQPGYGGSSQYSSSVSGSGGNGMRTGYVERGYVTSTGVMDGMNTNGLVDTARNGDATRRVITSVRTLGSAIDPNNPSPLGAVGTGICTVETKITTQTFEDRSSLSGLYDYSDGSEQGSSETLSLVESGQTSDGAGGEVSAGVSGDVEVVEQGESLKTGQRTLITDKICSKETVVRKIGRSGIDGLTMQDMLGQSSSTQSRKDSKRKEYFISGHVTSPKLTAEKVVIADKSDTDGSDSEMSGSEYFSQENNGTIIRKQHATVSSSDEKSSSNQDSSNGNNVVTGSEQSSAIQEKSSSHQGSMSMSMSSSSSADSGISSLTSAETHDTNLSDSPPLSAKIAAEIEAELRSSHSESGKTSETSSSRIVGRRITGAPSRVHSHSASVVYDPVPVSNIPVPLSRRINDIPNTKHTINTGGSTTTYRTVTEHSGVKEESVPVSMISSSQSGAISSSFGTVTSPSSIEIIKSVDNGDSSSSASSGSGMNRTKTVTTTTTEKSFSGGSGGNTDIFGLPSGLKSKTESFGSESHTVITKTDIKDDAVGAMIDNLHEKCEAGTTSHRESSDDVLTDVIKLPTSPTRFTSSKHITIHRQVVSDSDAIKESSMEEFHKTVDGQTVEHCVKRSGSFSADTEIKGLSNAGENVSSVSDENTDNTELQRSDSYQLKSIMKKGGDQSASRMKKEIKFAIGTVGGNIQMRSGQRSQIRGESYVSTSSDESVSTDEDEDDDDDDDEGNDSESSTGSFDEGSYDGQKGCIVYTCKDDEKIAQGTQGAHMFDQNIRETFDMNSDVRAACEAVSKHLLDGEELVDETLKSEMEIIRQEWFKISSQRMSNQYQVEDFLSAVNEISDDLLSLVINLSDTNGNSAVHYAVSHCNFEIVSLLIDTEVCDINKPNKAGYTPIMLASLAQVHSESQREVIRHLFREGDVNKKASQAGQTALMLAVSHGKREMVKLLLDCGADINAQDEDGSSALMCASEHGHADIVKVLLAQPEIDPLMHDNDGSTALSIAMDNGHRDIAVLLYAKRSPRRQGSPESDDDKETKVELSSTSL
ncbi:uncharacterized protein LOC141900804 isoform X3 [Tubulanus polymorphus]|uniref:uncharacterized protein LOC141900804 isoform X3 n=1 Tax=Tubulanus polymorphus TaxID=672921 RepID=UPI003DA4CF56